MGAPLVAAPGFRGLVVPTLTTAGDTVLWVVPRSWRDRGPVQAGSPRPPSGSGARHHEDARRGRDAPLGRAELALGRDVVGGPGDGEAVEPERAQVAAQAAPRAEVPVLATPDEALGFDHPLGDAAL